MKAKNRFSRIASIAKHTRKARKLFTGSGFAAATWGHQGSSLSDSRMVELERHALASTGSKPAGRCRTIALVLAFGLQGTPRSRIVRETMKAWFEVLAQLKPNVIEDLRVAWAKCRDAIKADPRDINVRGFLSNLVLLLTRASWVPETLNCWEDPRGDKWTLTSASSPPDIISNAMKKD